LATKCATVDRPFEEDLRRAHGPFALISRRSLSLCDRFLIRCRVLPFPSPQIYIWFDMIFFIFSSAFLFFLLFPFIFFIIIFFVRFTRGVRVSSVIPKALRTATAWMQLSVAAFFFPILLLICGAFNPPRDSPFFRSFYGTECWSPSIFFSPAEIFTGTGPLR